MKKSAHSFPKVYEKLGIDLGQLGCLMIDLAPPKFVLDEAWWTSINGADCIWYHANDKRRFWIAGFVGDKPHCTALYGFLKEAGELKEQITELLEDCPLPTHLEIDHFGYFDSPYEDEPYWCIVAHIKENLNLLAVHERLQMLPHIRTFEGYKAHATIAYIAKSQGEAYRDEIIKSLEQHKGTEAFYVLGLNYGENK